MKKRLLILGAGYHQLSLIRKALDLGHWVATLDNRPDNPGHQLSNLSINCSTLDFIGVETAAKQFSVDGVMSFSSDIALRTVSYVSSNLGLPGPLPGVVDQMIYKDKFRNFQQSKNLRHPRYINGNSFDTILKKISELSWPLIVKPVDGSGSRGISKLDKFEICSLRKAYEMAKSNSVLGEVCVEEYVPGLDFTGEFFLEKGEVVAGELTQKFMKGFVPIGHILPSLLSSKQKELALSSLKTTCNLLGYDNGPIDCDFRISEDVATIIEINPRLGGNGIPQLISHYMNLDLIEMSINLALGLPLNLRKNSLIRPCGSFVFGSEISGKLQNLISLDEIKSLVPSVFNIIYCRPLYSQVPIFQSSVDMIGCVLFDIPPKLTYADLTNNLRSLIKSHIEIL